VEAFLPLLPWIVGLMCLTLALIFFHRPLKELGRLALRTGCSLAALMALNPVGGLMGFHLGVNLCNALVMAVLGIPGAGLLLLLHWMVR